MGVFFATSDREACKRAARETFPRALVAIRPARNGKGYIYRSIKLSRKLADEMVLRERQAGSAEAGERLVATTGERLVATY